MPSADFCAAIGSSLDSPSPGPGQQRRSPEVSSTAFRAHPPDLRSAFLMDMDFANAGGLVQRSRLISGSCSSDRTFAPRFFQAPPRGESRPCASLVLHLHQVEQKTFTSELSSMLGTHRDRGEPRGSPPPTPPCMRVRTRRFGQIKPWSRDGRGLGRRSNHSAVLSRVDGCG